MPYLQYPGETDRNESAGLNVQAAPEEPGTADSDVVSTGASSTLRD